MRALLLTALMVAVGLAGCASGPGVTESHDDPVPDLPPFMDYIPDEPDLGMVLSMSDLFVPGTDGVTIHGRVTMPEGDGRFPTIVQHTPYTAPGCNTTPRGAFVEPPVVTCGEGTFENQFARRGYVYVHADLRGTGDSDGCLNLRGQADIDDIGALADAIAEQPWSNGNVGFIGASYPGSTSHMAAMSGSDAIKAVVPIVASTSFYHYHHNDGVPYSGQHSIGGTNTGYTQQGLTPTFNPASGLAKLVNQPLCPHVENAVMHGGMDQSGDFYDWWQERNLRPGAQAIDTPVLMAQGLADWNVKPDHIATWFNDLNSSSKTFIGGQWGHAYPASGDSACPGDYEGDGCVVPWGDWWAYASAFFDTYLKEIDTGMFEGSVAWVQDNNGTWHRSTTFPLMGDEAAGLRLYLNSGHEGTLGDFMPEDEAVTWHACPRDQYNMGQFLLAMAESYTVECSNTEIVFESEPFTQDMRISGVPLLNMSLDTEGKATHIVAVLDVVGGSSRENYGYLNTRFWQGFPEDADVPTGFYSTSLDFYPQEDLILEGQSLRLTIRSHDDGRTIEAFDEGDITLRLDETTHLYLPLRPAEMTGTRL